MVSNMGGRKPVVTGAVRTLTAGLALGAFAVSGTADGATGAEAAAGGPRVKPTVVLEHDAFADGSGWSGVIADLRADGYPVVAAGDPDVKALVYVAAFLPAPGETALELTGKFPGSTLPDALDPVTYRQADGTTTTDLYIRQDEFRHQFAADVPAGQAALMAAGQRPIAQAALEEKATVAAWKTKPSWDIVTTEDLNIPAAAQRFMAARAHARTIEVAASHSVAVSHPHLVADVIERAARATAR
ncbi:alpha/beta fold hydrolase [Streptomyces eurythermus]|uniref:alpha/beta fold hydrolase n=1 Tax=Streptomyces eurythermus TaxID=42237 RepID=UPI0036FEA057